MAALAVDVWDSASRDRIEQLQWQLAHGLLALGQIVIIEWGTWGRAEIDALRLDARSLGAAVEFRYLDVALDVLSGRVRDRRLEEMIGSRPISHADLVSADARFERPDADELALYDEPDDLCSN